MTAGRGGGGEGLLGPRGAGWLLLALVALLGAIAVVTAFGRSTIPLAFDDAEVDSVRPVADTGGRLDYLRLAEDGRLRDVVIDASIGSRLEDASRVSKVAWSRSLRTDVSADPVELSAGEEVWRLLAAFGGVIAGTAWLVAAPRRHREPRPGDGRVGR